MEHEHMFFRPADGRLLQQSVLKHIKRRPYGVAEGAYFGNDAAVFKTAGGYEIQASGAAMTAWFSDGASVAAEEAAFVIAENQLATAGAEPKAVQVFLTMGRDFPENRVRSLMQSLNRLSEERGCHIVGGNTVYFGTGNDALIQIFMTGETPDTAAYPEAGRKAVPGDGIWFYGETGCLGAELLAAGMMKLLREHFSDSYIEEMRYDAGAFSVRRAAVCAMEAGAVYLHDVSYGGVYTALYQLAEAQGTGIAVRHEGLRIRQSVIELCEVLGINPYLLLGTGGLLMTVPGGREDAWRIKMEEAGFPVYPAGRITAEKARVVRAEGFQMERYLNLSDEEAMLNLVKPAEG